LIQFVSDSLMAAGNISVAGNLSAFKEIYKRLAKTHFTPGRYSV